MKKLFPVLLMLSFLFVSCGNSISNTEWVNVSSDIIIIFNSNGKAIMKAGSAGDISVTYTYDKPKIVISAPQSADMHGIIDGDKMTFYNTLNNAVFVKK